MACRSGVVVQQERPKILFHTDWKRKIARRILDQEHAMAIARIHDRCEIGGQSQDVRDQHRLRLPQTACPAPVQFLRHQRRIHVPRRVVGINEHRPRAEISDGVDGGGAGGCPVLLVGMGMACYDAAS